MNFIYHDLVISAREVAREALTVIGLDVAGKGQNRIGRPGVQWIGKSECLVAAL